MLGPIGASIGIWDRGVCSVYIRGIGLIVSRTWMRTRSITRSISGAGQGRTSETARSATQKRVNCWWSRAADSGLAPGPRSTEARMSSMSIGPGLGGRVIELDVKDRTEKKCGGGGDLGSWWSGRVCLGDLRLT